MKEEKKPGSRTFYRIGCCLLISVVFLTISLQGAAREKPVLTGNSRLFNHYGDDNGLFSQGYMSGVDMSSQAQIEPIKDKPQVNGGKLFGEIFLGMLGNVGGGFFGALIGSQVIEDDDEGLFHGRAVLGYFTGSTLGSALGVYIIGNSGDAKGSFGSALLGSLLGECAAIAVLLLTRDGTAALISFIALPPIGAALLFNSSLKYKSLPLSHALLNFNKGDLKVGIPYVHIQPIPGYAKNVKPTVRFDVNLMSIVF
ncbi:MAG: hypothetical protein JSV88_08500 [Candidatus Aminicenantes bacterium]|nr:MAG: hypothetical protein JSV88_08500 [Candidatus Aminicenantes bacterium]